MDSRNTLLVDVSNLNVVYKVGTHLSCALNFSGNIGRLAELLHSMGTGITVYLCVKPNLGGDGNLSIKGLDTAALPFTVDRDLMFAAYSFFRNSESVGDIYICNWLVNYASLSKLSDCTSVLWYGGSVLSLSIRNKLVNSFKVYSCQSDYEAERQDGDRGDTDVLDLVSLRVRYPELGRVRDSSLTALAPIIKCLNTSIMVNAIDVEWDAKVEEPPIPTAEQEVEPAEHPASKAGKGAELSAKAVWMLPPILVLGAFFGFVVGTYTNVGVSKLDSASLAEDMANTAIYQSVAEDFYTSKGNLEKLETIYSKMRSNPGVLEIKSIQLVDGLVLVECKVDSESFSDLEEELSRENTIEAVTEVDSVAGIYLYTLR